MDHYTSISVERAIQQIKSGGMVILVDDKDRENEGDLVFAAEQVTAEKINFMAKHARGLICLSLPPERVNELKLSMMSDFRSSTQSAVGKETAFTVSIEARSGVSTGISAQDRARTIQVAIDPKTVPSDLSVPGHIFPLKARPGGVLERAGHTEGSIDLVKLAGFHSHGAVICEIMNEDGTMARFADLEKFAVHFDLPIVSIADLIQYRLQRESFLKRVSGPTVFKSHFGTFHSYLYQNQMDSLHHLVFTNQSFSDEQVAHVRVQKKKPLLDLFSGLDDGFKVLNEHKNAVFIYLNSKEVFDDQYYNALVSENKIDKMDDRTFGVGAQILRDLGVRKMILHSSSPKALKALSGFELEVVDTKIMEPREML